MQQINTLIETYPWQVGAAITLAFLLTLAKLYPAKLYLFRIKFKYANRQTMIQFNRVPNILARIFFYSKPTIVRYIGNHRQWYTFVEMGPQKKITNPRMIHFLWSEEAREHIAYKKRTVKKVRE